MRSRPRLTIASIVLSAMGLAGAIFHANGYVIDGLIALGVIALAVAVA